MFQVLVIIDQAHGFKEESMLQWSITPLLRLVGACLLGWVPGSQPRKGAPTAELTLSLARQQTSLSPAVLCQHWQRFCEVDQGERDRASRTHLVWSGSSVPSAGLVVGSPF